MSTYFNAMSATEGKDGKSHFNKVGVAFPGKEDSNLVMKLKLFAVPINGEILLFKPNTGDDDSNPIDDQDQG